MSPSRSKYGSLPTLCSKAYRTLSSLTSYHMHALKSRFSTSSTSTSLLLCLPKRTLRGGSWAGEECLDAFLQI